MNKICSHNGGTLLRKEDNRHLGCSKDKRIKRSKVDTGRSVIHVRLSNQKVNGIG